MPTNEQLNGFLICFNSNNNFFKNADGVKVMRTGDIVFYNYTSAPFCLDK